ncbi:CYTOCHROME P450 FAMILY 705 SUBFAMILY A POLYPEPTIDE 25-RELATED [Salix koriyanagi]|uniref:CYTOCHROME P450 FAMILY 705 SUBFAMILY A POLYPEPTIDE 25-RELATED n=1 Tax=Salix koriyanagi TaxID=2511006 RepID=A0A9Q0TR14_9ROSI|nr:CYTOCHROME P450 FAMILY 705 SUBFAMILY A POLYPEPTIDE 25-RELATED [Salix koriyanagi]
MTAIPYVLAFLILLFITVFIQYIFKRPGKKPAGYCPPPSPPALPFIGHLHLLTPVAYKGFHALSNKYGPLLYLRLATYPAVLVSSAPLATEMFKALDVHFASRIKSPFDDNLLFGSSTSFFNAPYGDYWKFMKKICTTELLGTSQMKKLKNVRREEVVRFLRKMLEIGQKNEVANLSAEILTLANNSTCRMIMSARCSGEDNQAEKCRALVSESFDLASQLALLSVFGPLKRIGMWYLRKKIAAVPKRYDELFENVLVEHEEKAKREGPDMENKDLMDILLEVYHDENAEIRITRKQMKTFFLDLFTGGTNTTSDAILWILAELVSHPAAFKKLREEIDSVVGTERLVDEADIPSMPYFQACVKEAMRLNPPVPLFDRICRENCKLAGYDIPKGITMIMNAYSIMRDPEIWDNPNDFIPERFLTGVDNAREKNLQVYVPFGGGRRMCPGVNMTSSLINCSVTAMVQCFDLKVLGGDGPDGLKVNMDTKPGVVKSMDRPFMAIPVLHSNLFSV